MTGHACVPPGNRGRVADKQVVFVPRSRFESDLIYDNHADATGPTAFPENDDTDQRATAVR